MTNIACVWTGTIYQLNYHSNRLIHKANSDLWKCFAEHRNMSYVINLPSTMCNQVELKPARSATEASTKYNESLNIHCILSINEKLRLTRVHLTREHMWSFLDGELPSIHLSFFVVHIPMYRYYRKQCSWHMDARHPFTNERVMFPLSSMGTCQVMVAPESLNLACSIWSNIRSHFDGVFKEYLSGLFWHVWFWK